jgi:hypothetical protein
MDIDERKAQACLCECAQITLVSHVISPIHELVKLGQVVVCGGLCDVLGFIRGVDKRRFLAQTYKN